MGSLEVSDGKKKRIDPTSMLAADPIIGMNLSSSQTELVQSWGLGHSGPTLVFTNPYQNLQLTIS
jgi:hypothetical protein